MHFQSSITPPVLGWGNPFTTKGRRKIKRGVSNSASSVMDLKRKTENALNDYVVEPMEKYVYEPIVGNVYSQIRQIPRRARNLSDALLNLDRSVPNLWKDVTTDPLSLFEAFPMTDFFSDVTGDYYKLGKELAVACWNWLINNLVNVLFGFINLLIDRVGTLNIFKYGSDILGKYMTMLNALIASATAGLGALISQLATLSVSQVIDMVKNKVQSEVEKYFENQVKSRFENLESQANYIKDFELNEFVDRQVKSALSSSKDFIKNKLTGAKTTVENTLSNMQAPQAKSLMERFDSEVNMGQMSQIVNNQFAQNETQKEIEIKEQNEAREMLFEEQQKVIQSSGFDPSIYDLMLRAGFENKIQAQAYFDYRNQVIKNNNIILASLLGLATWKMV